MGRPKTRYAKTADGAHVAHQVLGNGPIDVVFAHAFVSHLELLWELPSYARFFRELSSWGGDHVRQTWRRHLRSALVVPTLEARIDDLRAVLDAVESERTLVVGNSEGGALAAMFVATYPERTSPSGGPQRPPERVTVASALGGEDLRLDPASDGSDISSHTPDMPVAGSVTTHKGF